MSKIDEAMEIERLAQFLHDEGGFGDAYPDHTWPEHENDDGRRQGGFVKIVPAHAQEQFRDVARRWLHSRPQAALRAQGAGEGGANYEKAWPKFDESKLS